MITKLEGGKAKAEIGQVGRSLRLSRILSVSLLAFYFALPASAVIQDFDAIRVGTNLFACDTNSGVLLLNGQPIGGVSVSQVNSILATSTVATTASSALSIGTFGSNTAVSALTLAQAGVTNLVFTNASVNSVTNYTGFISTNGFGGSGGSGGGSFVLITNGLVAYWPLNGDLNDYSLNGVPLSSTGGGYFTNNVITGNSLSQAYWLDGTENLATTKAVANMAPLLTNNAVSIVFWVKSSMPGNSGFVYINNSAGAVIFQYYGSFGADLGRTGGNTSTHLYPATTYCCIATLDSSGNFTTYVNGTVASATSGTAGYDFTSNWGEVNIGVYSGVGWNVLGAVNGVRIYNRCLSPTEVAEISSGTN